MIVTMTSELMFLTSIMMSFSAAAAAILSIMTNKDYIPRKPVRLQINVYILLNH